MADGINKSVCKESLCCSWNHLIGIEGLQRKIEVVAVSLQVNNRHLFEYIDSRVGSNL